MALPHLKITEGKRYWMSALLTFALNKCKELGLSNVILQASEVGFWYL